MNLTSINIQSNYLLSFPSLVYVKNTVKSINILGNRQSSITTIDHDVFRGCNQLKEISLIACSLLSVPNLNYISQTLERLYLPDNNISSLASMHRIYFYKLKVLELDKNHIIHINPELLYLPKIRRISFSHNFLQHIDLRFNNWVNGPIDIGLSDNPWNCSLNWDWIIQGCLTYDDDQYIWQHTQHSPKLILDALHMLVCQYPKEQHGRKVISSEMLESHAARPCRVDGEFLFSEALIYICTVFSFLTSTWRRYQRKTFFLDNNSSPICIINWFR